MLVLNHSDIELIGNDLKFMFYLVAGISTVLVILVIFCKLPPCNLCTWPIASLPQFSKFLLVFEAEPPTPPSSAAQGSVQSGNESSPFLHSVGRLLSNRNFILLLLSYGINVGVFYAISTLLNQVSVRSRPIVDGKSKKNEFNFGQIILVYYPGQEQDAGRIGLFIILAGMTGSVCCGIVLDKTHRFKWVTRRCHIFALFFLGWKNNDCIYRETTLAVYGFSMIAMWIYTFTLNIGHIAIVYVTSALLG